jgi:hypothetical protein
MKGSIPFPASVLIKDGNINYPIVIAAFIAIILIVWLICRNCRVFFGMVYRDNILAKGGTLFIKKFPIIMNTFDLKA